MLEARIQLISAQVVEWRRTSRSFGDAYLLPLHRPFLDFLSAHPIRLPLQGLFIGIFHKVNALRVTVRDEVLDSLGWVGCREDIVEVDEKIHAGSHENKRLLAIT